MSIQTVFNIAPWKKNEIDKALKEAALDLLTTE